MNKKMVLGAVGIVLAGAGAVVYNSLNGAASGFIDPSDQRLVMQGKTIYANNCASCHGADLQGQPDWRRARLPSGRLPAPPHDKTGHTWHHPDALLIDMVKNSLVPGKTAPRGYETDMPAYGEVLSDQEIIAVLAYIKSSWPANVLDMQKEVTMQQKRR